MLKDVIHDLKIGTVDPDGTSLGTAIATAVNRLRYSKAKSKVIILLTDGIPGEEKITPDTAILLAKKLNIKIYTIGVGNSQGAFFNDPYFGIKRVPVQLDMRLLPRIAEETGGKAFRANKPHELRMIYSQIDSLEKTSYEADIYNKYYEAFDSFVWLLILVLFAELWLKLFTWRGIL